MFLIVSASVLQIYSALRLLCIPFPKEFSAFNGGGYSIAVTAVCAACVLVCLLDAHIVKKKNSDFCTNEKSYVQIGSGALSGARPGKAERREKRITAAVGVLLILCATGVITAMFVKKGIYIDYGENKFILTKYYDTPKEAFTEYISDAWRITGPAAERTDEWQTVKIDELNLVCICVVTDVNGETLTAAAPLYRADEGYAVTGEALIYGHNADFGEYVKISRIATGKGRYGDDLYFKLDKTGTAKQRISFEEQLYYDFVCGSDDDLPED